MLSKHDQQPLADDKPSQLASKHLRQLHCDSNIAPISGVSPSRAILQEPPSSDELLDISNNNKDIKNVTAVAPIDNFTSLHGNTCLLPVVGNITDGILSYQSKRPLYDDAVYLVTCKRPRQVDQNVCLDPYAETQLRASLPPSPGLIVVNDDLKKREAAGYADFDNDLTSSSQLAFGSCYEETVSKSPVQLPPPRSYFDNYCQAVGLCQADELVSPVFDDCPRKPVAIGADHQANIPEWGSHSRKKTRESSHCASPLVHSNGFHLVNEDNSGKWIGCCIIPMPDPSLASEIEVVLHKADCSCLDEGSVRCVRQHVNEAREKLKKNLGLEKFDQLGICNMGEDVANKWTEEEEHLFRAVVLSNPASLGKNFWNVLPYFFPARGSKELVSYYFNAFMLRKRAEQNRLDPLNVDSDDDEWQRSDDGEFAVVEEDEEDSSVESLVDQDAVTCNKGDDEDVEIHEDIEDGDDCDDYAIAREKGERFCGDPEGCNMDIPNFLPPVEHLDKQNCVLEQDVQDDSCTSYEGHHGADACGGLSDGVDPQQHGSV